MEMQLPVGLQGKDTVSMSRDLRGGTSNTRIQRNHTTHMLPWECTDLLACEVIVAWDTAKGAKKSNWHKPARTSNYLQYVTLVQDPLEIHKVSVFTAETVHTQNVAVMKDNFAIIMNTTDMSV